MTTVSLIPIINKPKKCKSDQVQSLRKQNQVVICPHTSSAYVFALFYNLFRPASVWIQFPPARLTLTVEITRVLLRFTGSAHIWDNYVFFSGRGLIQRDWIGLAGTVCVFAISAERLWMIGVSDTACFLLGRSWNRWNRGLQKTTHSFHLSIITALPRTQLALTGTNTHLYVCACCLCVSRNPWTINLLDTENSIVACCCDFTHRCPQTPLLLMLVLNSLSFFYVKTLSLSPSVVYSSGLTRYDMECCPK